MIIRNAKLSDTKEIVSIANALKINGEPQKNNGFLVYVLDKKDYEKRIRHSKYFYVAELTDRIIGFLMCYDNTFLLKLKNKNLISHENKIIDFVLSQNRPFIFGDQIGVLYEYVKTGVGMELMKNLLNKMRKEEIGDMYVAILHKPVLNMASLNFCRKIGFKFIKEIENNDKKIWGIYILTLK